MKQNKNRMRIGNPSIWHNMPKGVRAGNSPVWTLKELRTSAKKDWPQHKDSVFKRDAKAAGYSEAEAETYLRYEDED